MSDTTVLRELQAWVQLPRDCYGKGSYKKGVDDTLVAVDEQIEAMLAARARVAAEVSEGVMVKKHTIEQDELDNRLFLRPKELAALIGVEETIVYRSIYAGEIRASKFRGNMWLIKREDAFAWIDENSVANVPMIDEPPAAPELIGRISIEVLNALLNPDPPAMRADEI